MSSSTVWLDVPCLYGPESVTRYAAVKLWDALGVRSSDESSAGSFITFILDSEPAIESEAYTLDIRCSAGAHHKPKAAVFVTASCDRGLIQGLHHLLQLVRHPLGPAARNVFTIAATHTARRTMRQGQLSSIPLPDPFNPYQYPDLMSSSAVRALVDFHDFPRPLQALSILDRWRYPPHSASTGIHARCSSHSSPSMPPSSYSPASIPVQLPVVSVSSAPKFSWRGALLDASRHFFPVQAVLQFIELMATLRLNTLHFHLVDDQGFRLHVPALPRLTDVGAWRPSMCPDDSTSQLDSGFTLTPQFYGGFYSEGDIRTIVAFALQRGIEVVPEIDVPGHAWAALVSYPHQLACEGSPAAQPGQGVPTRWGVLPDSVLCTRESAFQTLFTVLDRVCDLFPSKYIHIGGDEVLTDTWTRCGSCKARMRELGLDSAKGLHGYFISRVAAHLALKGKTAIAWDDVMESEFPLPQDLVVMCWRPEAQAMTRALLKGHRVIVCPTTHTYLDFRQVVGLGPGAWRALLTAQDAAQFDPMEGVDASLRECVLGGQGNLWSEYVPALQQLEFQSLPRLGILADLLWGSTSDSSVQDSDSSDDSEALWALHGFAFAPRGWDGRGIIALSALTL